MKTALLVAAIGLAVGACGRGGDDKTSDLKGTLLSAEARAKFDADGLAPRMLLAQAIKTVQQRHSDVLDYNETEDEYLKYYFGKNAENEKDTIELTSYPDLKPAYVTKVTVTKHYVEGARADSVYKTLTEKYGELLPYSAISQKKRVDAKEVFGTGGTFYAGEGIASSGDILKDCHEFQIRRQARCGLMAKIDVEADGGVVSTVKVELQDSLFEKELNSRKNDLDKAAENESRKSKVDRATVVNSF